MRIAAAIARAPEDVDGNATGGTTNAKSIAAMGGAHEGLEHGQGSSELKRDGEGGSRGATRRRRSRRGKIVVEGRRFAVGDVRRQGSDGLGHLFKRVLQITAEQGSQHRSRQPSAVSFELDLRETRR